MQKRRGGRFFRAFRGNNRGMKILYENCVLPLSGARRFAVEDGKFVRPLPPFGRVCDLNGAAVLPAFLDAHSHLLAYAVSLTQADGAACRTAGDYAACAEKFARAHGAGKETLVTIRNADIFPDPAALDRVPRPLHLQARSGHAGMFNGAARALLGLEKAGVLEETDYIAATKKVPMPAEDELFRAFAQAQRDYIAHGFSLAQEGVFPRTMFPVYAALCERDMLRLDVVAYPPPEDFDDAVRAFPPDKKSRLSIGGMKIFLDGSPQQRTAFLREPYRGGGRGVQTMTEAEVSEACAFAAARGAQLLAHCNGDGAAEIFLNALARLPDDARRAVRPVLIHGQIVGDDQLSRAAALGVTLSFFPAHVRHWGDAHLKNLGRERAERISPARTALDRGARVTLHQDTPVCAPDPLEAAACAVLRRTAGGEIFRKEAITVREALTALTGSAAAQYGLRGRGRIAEGGKADFLLLGDDPLALPPERLERVKINAVFLDGRCAFRRTP